MPEEDANKIEGNATVPYILGQLEVKVEYLVNLERSRSEELTKLLDLYQKNIETRIMRLEKDAEADNKRLESTDADLRNSIAEQNKKFENALKTTNNTVTSLRDKVVGFTAILALLTILSPFLPRMLASVLYPSHPGSSAPAYTKP